MEDKTEKNENNKKRGVKKIGKFYFFIGIIFPAFVIAFEVVTKMCANVIFDPLPTFFHIILVSYVPFANFYVWKAINSNNVVSADKLLIISSISLGIAGYYALLFLPIIPFSIFGILFYGLGLLPLAPVTALLVNITLSSYVKTKYESEFTHKYLRLKGISFAIFLLIVLDLPATITHFGLNLAVSDTAAKRTDGVQLLRKFGDEEMLLNLCYRGGRRATGIASFILLRSSESQFISTSKTREVFYRVTGEKFDSRKPPYSGGSWSLFDDFAFDRGRGGSEVGSLVKGLYLITSRLDGSVASDDGVSYIEWVMEFKNEASFANEARLQMELPNGAVISRATLWVEGEEREAAFAGRAQVKQAYTSVVRQSRDPLLVTTQGANRVLIQAFPIPGNSGSLKLRVGISIPMSLSSQEQASFVLPAIVDRNFSYSEDFGHTVWIESKQPFSVNNNSEQAKLISQSLHRYENKISDIRLSGNRIKLTAQRNREVVELISSHLNSTKILQKVTQKQIQPKSALMLVLDGSTRAAIALDDVLLALQEIPNGVPVGLIVAGEDETFVEIKEWSEHHQANFERILKEVDFVGGQDNAPALSKAIRDLESYENSELLWIASSQPVLFDATNTEMDLAVKRLSRLPEISLYHVRSGANKLLDNSTLLGNSTRMIEWSEGERAILQQYVKSLFQSEAVWDFDWTVSRDSNSDIKNGSDHIARLWASEEIKQLAKLGEIDSAIEMASQYQLVTSVSGAVVLENQRQYEENNLTPVDEKTVPTIPEPHQWALIFIILALILWFLKQNRSNLIKQA
ncbi:MAG: VIT domain-containing protein [Gammaproteobacteria bacterium]|nr:VIT domain-containing protein [Gammaproteobacteria bacterium]